MEAVRQSEPVALRLRQPRALMAVDATLLQDHNGGTDRPRVRRLIGRPDLSNCRAGCADVLLAVVLVRAAPEGRQPWDTLGTRSTSTPLPRRCGRSAPIRAGCPSGM